LTLLETIELAEQVGDVQRANESRQATKEMIGFISDHIDEPALRASFQNLPQIRSVLAA
jgi:hypothetical protein